jgi:hypothetical protein
LCLLLYRKRPAGHTTANLLENLPVQHVRNSHASSHLQPDLCLLLHRKLAEGSIHHFAVGSQLVPQALHGSLVVIFNGILEIWANLQHVM